MKWTHPNGCLYDGEPQREHCRLWHPVVGWHSWVEPTNQLRLLRMLANRLIRIQGEK